MAKIARIGSWPLAWKVPLLVAALMVGIAVMISQVVLTRLGANQESNLRQLTDAYLDGLSAAVLQPAVRADVWETFDALDRARHHYSGVDARFVLVEMPDNKILAASDPARFPTGGVVPADLAKHFSATSDFVIDDSAGRAWLARTLQVEGFSVGRILAEVDIAELLRVRREVLQTLILVNGALTLAFAAIGYFALKRMLQPLGVLTNYVEHIREGRAEPIPEGTRRRIAAEFRQLFDRFNAMALALSERETLASHLAEQEKYAVLGKLASGMAHEVNNPLGGLFNALDTLRRHGSDPSVRESTLNLLHRGLSHIRNVVRSTLVMYRREASAHSAGAADIDDLRLLIEPETARRQIGLDWVNEVRGKLPVAVGSVRQATLNLLINACAATPRGGVVGLRAIENDDSLVIEVADGGPGLQPALAKYLVSATDETTPSGDGLGLWIVRRLVADEGGSIRVACGANGGTIISVTWPYQGDRIFQSDVDALSGEDIVHAG